MPSRAASPLAVRSLAVMLALGACRTGDAAPEMGAATLLDRSAHERPPEPAPAPAPISADPVVMAIVELAAADSQVDDHLRSVALDFGPRLSGSTQIADAQRWAVERFEGWGLTATREQWGEFPVGFERGEATGQVIRPEREALEFTTWAWTPGTHAPAKGQRGGLEAGAPMRGQALRYPSNANALRELEPYLRHAWIMIPHDGPTGPTGTDRSIDKTLRRQIERALDRAPIAGVVRAAGGPDDQLIQSHGNHRLNPAKLPERVEIRLRGDQHAGLLERMAAGEYVELEFGVANRLLPGPVPVHNVIAELPGKELPDERVVVGGHLDSWDGASGAVDNGTGVATTMEAARLIAAACERHDIQPRRTISFMLWSGEEQGLLGSKAWVEAHPEQLEGISAVLVHDNGTNYISGLAVTPEMWAQMQSVFEPIQKLAPETMPFALRVVEALPWEPSDSSSFMRGDVPSFFWDQDGRSDYQRYHHTQHDHFDAVIDEYQRHSALVVAIAAWNLAQLDAPIERHNALGLPARRIGVELEGPVIERVRDGGVGAAAGLRAGDRILEIDGHAVSDHAEIVAAIQEGGSAKSALIDRKQQRITVQLDWSADPDEQARAARRDERRRQFGPELRPWDHDNEHQPNDE